MKTYSTEEYTPLYVKNEPVRSLSMIINCIEAYGVLDTDMPGATVNFIKQIGDYENDKARKVTKKEYQQRFGMLFRCLLPLGEKKNSIKKKIVRKFVKDLRGEEKDLKYCSWEAVQGKGSYIYIYICDREFVKNRKTYYKRDYYVDSCGKMCSKHCDDKRLVKRKGEFKEYVNGFMPTKSRIFFDKNVESFRNRILEFWKSACDCLLEKGKYIFRRKKIGQKVNRWTRRLRIRQNHLMSYIENCINKYYELIYEDGYDSCKNGSNGSEELYTAKNRKLDELFFKYRNRFIKESFHVDDVEFLMKGRADIAEAAIDYLKELFNQEMELIVSGV